MSKPFDPKPWIESQAATFSQKWGRPVKPEDLEAFKTSLNEVQPKGKLEADRDLDAAA